MAIELQCSCGRKLRVDDQFASRECRCPVCQAVLPVPADSTDLSPDVPADATPDASWADFPPPKAGSRPHDVAGLRQDAARGISPSKTTSIKIRFGQPLPELCALCGEPAVSKMTVTCRWDPGGSGGEIHVMVHILLFGILGALMSPRLERVRLAIPVCQAHRHWQHWQTLRMLGIVGLWVLCSVALAVAIVVSFMAAAAGVIAAMLIMLIVSYWRAAKRVRPGKADHRGCVLSGLDPRFVVAFHEKYRCETEEVEQFLDNL